MLCFNHWLNKIAGISATVPVDVTGIATEKTLRIVYYTIGTISILGNGYVILVMFHSSLVFKTITNLYICNQSAVDLCVAITLVSSAYISGNSVPSSGVAGEMYCKLWLTKFLLWGFLVNSTYNLVIMTMERYACVIHPIWHKVNRMACFFRKMFLMFKIYLCGTIVLGYRSDGLPFESYSKTYSLCSIISPN